MARRSRVFAVLVTLPLLLTAIGCSKKPEPVAPPPPPPPAAPPVEVPPPPPPAPPDPVEPRPLTEVQSEVESRGLLGDVYFEFDRYELGSSAKERLAKNADWMKGEGAEFTFTVEGHCDERGTNEYNLALGQRRSNEALSYIVSLGVDRNRFKTISYGEERPFCRESNESCWQKNRRARFVINGRK